MSTGNEGVRMTEKAAQPQQTSDAGEAPAPKTSRAGRNLPAAVAVGGSLGVGVILVLVFVPLVWIPVVAVSLAVATWEVVKRVRDGGHDVGLIPLLVGGQAIMWSAWPWGPTGALVAFVATVLVLSLIHI